MSELATTTIIGMLCAAWAIGFTSGFLMTRYREAINMIS